MFLVHIVTRWAANILRITDEQFNDSAVWNVADLRNGWQIISPSKSFTVYAATASEKTEWMAHIEKCAADLRNKRKHNALCGNLSAACGHQLRLSEGSSHDW